MKKIAIYLALVVVLSLSFVIPCFATTSVDGDTITWDGDISGATVTSQWSNAAGTTFYYYFVPVSSNVPSLSFVQSEMVSYTRILGNTGSFETESAVLPSGDEEYYGDEIVTFKGIWFVYVDNATFIYGDSTLTFPSAGVYFQRTIRDDGWSSMPTRLVVSGFAFEPLAGPTPTGIYWDIFDILHTHIYGGAELTSDMNLVLTMLSTTACLFCFAVPFMVVWWVIKRIT